MIESRWYQDEAVNSIFEWFNTNQFGNPVVQMPTGTGKSIVIARFIQEALQRFPTTRVLMLTHVKELIDQNGQKLLSLWPQAPMGIFSAGLKKKEPYLPVVFGGVQSVVKLLEKDPSSFGHRDLVLIDECHLLSPKESSSYQKVLKHLRTVNPYVRVIGFTATAFRLKTGMITDGEGLFDATCYDLCSTENFNRLLAEGFLCPLIPKRPKTQIDVSTLGVLGGEYNAKELEEILDEQIMRGAVEEMVLYGQDRKSWLVFASGIEKAERIAELLNEYGIDAATSHSKLTGAENDERIQAFKDGKLRALVNSNKLTTGFDHPGIDLIGMLRPTESPGLWVQMLGRGTRPSPNTGKWNCLATDTLVLTDQGQVPIQEVTLEMKLWDGVDWVSHNGVIFCGEQETITYAGLTATADHKVWTEKGWKTIGECRLEQNRIARTGNSGQPIQEASGHFIGGYPKRQKSASVCKDAVCRMFKRIRNRLFKFDFFKGKLSFLWEPSHYSKMARYALHFCKTKMHQSERFGISALRSARSRVSFRISFSDGAIYARDVRTSQGVRDRQNRQLGALRAGQSAMVHESSESCTHSQESKRRQCSQLANNTPSYSLCGWDSSKYVRKRNDTGANRGAVLQEVKKTKRQVWDILNAGPLHRFTANDALVSNCLVLDFAGNTSRLGPINDPTIPGKPRKGAPGEAPVKVCNACGCYNHASARFCGICNAEFIFENKLSNKASEYELIRASENPPEDLVLPPMELQVFDVAHMIYDLYKKDVVGSFPTLKVTYCTPSRAFTEWLGFSKPGHGRRIALEWWKRRANGLPLPQTSEEAYVYAQRLLKPSQIRVNLNGKYPSIVDYNFS